MIFLNNIEVEFAGRVLFNNLNFTINNGDRITFAGYNGTGKSTLMKVIVGKIEPTKGEIKKSKHIDIGYLPQDGIHVSGKTLFNEVESVFDEILEIQKEIDKLGEQLNSLSVDDKKYHKTLDKMGDLQLQLKDHDLDRMKPQIEIILNGLGFSKEDLNRDTGEFSGGWQMRIALAKLLLQNPDVLLLDEPTNHLDIESQRWLESFLRKFNGALVVISHDKGFLDLLCDRTLAFANKKATEYSGNYSYYVKRSREVKEQLLKAKENQDKEIKEIQDFINRFRYNSKKATLVQSRIKMLDKIERIEVDKDDAVVKFQFPSPPKSGHNVLLASNLTKKYDDLTVFENFDIDIEKGDCIAIVGVNGAGKSTFVRLISQIEEPTSGEIKFGYNVLPSYFSQTLSDELPTEKTILETVEEEATGASRANVRNVLGCFLFRGNDVFKQNKVLSGGERSRVALVRMLTRPANFLIMDEPTNHLDIPSQEILQHALKNYTGTMVIVSHNREFLDPIANKVIEFSPNHPPKTYLGNISDYLDKKERDDKAIKETKKVSKTESLSKNTTPKTLTLKDLKDAHSKSPHPTKNPNLPKNKKELRKLKAKLREQRAVKLNPLKEKLDLIETDIKVLEANQKEFSEKMNDADYASDPDNVLEFTKNSQKLNSALKMWETTQNEIERVEEELGGII